MRFINETPLQAALTLNAEPGDMVSAVVVVSATFAVEADDSSAPRLSREQRPLVLGNTFEPNDRNLDPPQSLSVCATGFVYPPSGRAARAAAALTVGAFSKRIAAFGTRVWKKGIGGSLVASEPLPFERIEMSWENAFGGRLLEKTMVVKLDGRDAIAAEHTEGFSMNLDGKGYYTRADQAIDQPLPLLENPARLLQSCTDWVEPVCFAPYGIYGALRGLALLDRKIGKIDLGRIPTMFGRAAPNMAFPLTGAGHVVRLEGMRPKGETLAFRTPALLVGVEVAVGPECAELPITLCSIDLDAEARVARMVYRAAARFALVQFEERTITVKPTPNLAASAPRQTQEGR